MDVRDRLRLSMPLLLLNHTTHTLHTNILRCNKGKAPVQSNSCTST